MKCKNYVPQLIVDERMRKIEKENLKKIKYNLIEIKQSNMVYEEISAHVDIFVCKIGNKLIIEPSQYKLIKDQLTCNFKIEQGKEKLEKKISIWYKI